MLPEIYHLNKKKEAKWPIFATQKTFRKALPIYGLGTM
jgi:hypothetical protein